MKLCRSCKKREIGPDAGSSTLCSVCANAIIEPLENRLDHGIIMAEKRRTGKHGWRNKWEDR